MAITVAVEGEVVLHKIIIEIPARYLVVGSLKETATARKEINVTFLMKVTKVFKLDRETTRYKI